MSTDHDLLKMAARAAGITWFDHDGVPVTKDFERWNPLLDDGDAFRLAVKLRVIPVIEEWSDGLWVFVPSYPGCGELLGNDPLAATRRAIVRAAAAIGG